jgi:hypothetical protein
MTQVLGASQIAASCHVLVVESRHHERRSNPVNLNADDPVGARNRAIMFGLVTLVVLGTIVGLGVGWLGSRAVDSTGIDDVEPPDDGRPGIADDPFEDFTAGPSETEDTAEPTEPTESETTPTTPTEPTKTRDPREPTLNAAPMTADEFERVALTGRFPGMDAGMTLYVERKEGGAWSSFADVTMTTDQGGTYSTWIETGQTGPNRFRITAESGESTPTVTVQIT